MDCSPPGFSVHGILQARILEGVAISFSRGSSQPRNWTQFSCIAGRWFTNWAMREAPSPSLEPNYFSTSIRQRLIQHPSFPGSTLLIYCCVLSQSVQSLSHVQLFATPWTAAQQASMSITNSQSLLKRMPIELVMSSNHLILCHPLLLPPSIFPSIRIFFQWVSSSHQVAKVLDFQFQHQSFQWIFRTDLL